MRSQTLQILAQTEIISPAERLVKFEIKQRDKLFQLRSFKVQPDAILAATCKESASHKKIDSDVKK